MTSEPAFNIKVYASSELTNQPWISNLTQMVNISYRVSHTTKIKFITDKKRLHTDSQLSNELGAEGITAVAFAETGNGQKCGVIGTASLKEWTDDGLWTAPTEHEHNMISADENAVNGEDEQVHHQHSCPGDYEIAIVALLPDPRFRGKGIAGHLVRACEKEVLRRHRATSKNISSPVRIMAQAMKENAGSYWLKQGFTLVGARRCPEGFYDALEEFTLWALVRELSSI